MEQILKDVTEYASELPDLLATLVAGTPAAAVKAGLKLQAFFLEKISQVGAFNAKELLWWGVLLREARRHCIAKAASMVSGSFSRG